MQGKLTANGSTGWVKIIEGGDIYISVNGTFGGGSVAVEKRINDTAYPVRSSGSPIAHAADDDSVYGLVAGSTIRLTLTGATSPSIDWAIESEKNFFAE